MSEEIRWREIFKTVFRKRNVLAILVVGFFPPIIGLSRVILGFDPSPGQNYGSVDFLLGFVYSYIVTASLFFGSAIIIRVLNIKIPWKGNVSRRVLLEVLLVLSYTSLTQTFILWSLEGTAFIHIQGELEFKDYLSNVVFSNTITIIVVALIEGGFFFRNWRESLLTRERLEKEHAQSQLANLRSQLDPHFMFNSLNVLTGLIRQDPKQAESFVEDFARVYRHMLDVNDRIIVPLEDELKFTQQYLRLQSTRFKEGLKVNWNISNRAKEGYLPPLALQEVISNAIKHNAIHAEQVLQINISDNEESLEIRNNLQVRLGKMESTGFGLENIKERYQLLEARAPEFLETNGDFLARLPILQVEE